METFSRHTEAVVRFVLGASVVACSLLASTGIADAEAETVAEQRMPFAQCLQVIRDTAGKLGVAPINIVETNIVRVVRFPTTEGSLLVTCSKPDQKMVITKSDKKR